MQDVVVGLLSVLIGSALCFQGYVALRVAISLWGGLAGFALGAGAVVSLTDDNVLATLLGWFVALVLAALFAAFAYVYYAVAVIVTMASAGFALGAAAMVALDSSWTWAPAVAGVVLGAAVALVAVLADLPTIVLVVVGAAAGASVIVTGIMLLTNQVSAADFDTESVTRQIEHEGWWALLALALLVAGVVVQSAQVGIQRGLRQTWSTPAATRTKRAS
jgi:hypothetical protein